MKGVEHTEIESQQHRCNPNHNHHTLASHFSLFRPELTLLFDPNRPININNGGNILSKNMPKNQQAGTPSIPTRERKCNAALGTRNPKESPACICTSSHTASLLSPQQIYFNAYFPCKSLYQAFRNGANCRRSIDHRSSADAHAMSLLRPYSVSYTTQEFGSAFAIGVS